MVGNKPAWSEREENYVNSRHIPGKARAARWEHQMEKYTAGN